MGENPRDRVLNVFTEKLGPLGFSDVDIKNFEISIYNSIIDLASKQHMPKTWNNHTFKALYLYKAQAMYSNVIRPNVLYRLQSKELVLHEIPGMSADEIAPENWTEIIANEEAKMKNAYEIQEVAMTDQIICGKCKKRNVSYREKQTRSGDEGMTVFYKCIDCGHTWRQS